MHVNFKALHKFIAIHMQQDSDVTRDILHTMAKVIVQDSYTPIALRPTRTQGDASAIVTLVHVFPLTPIALPHLERYNFPLAKHMRMKPQVIDDIETWKSILASCEHIKATGE